MDTRTNELFGVPEAAAIAGVEPITVRRWLEADELPGTRVGERWLLLRRDLLTYVTERAARKRLARRERATPRPAVPA